MAPHTVVILGGSYGGMPIAHYLLKYTYKTHKDLKVILVSKNSHMYWNLASVRAIVPGAIPDDGQLFGSLAEALSRYPAGSNEVIIGTATHADFAARTVTVRLAGDGSSRTLSYDQLVLATGSRTAAADSVPWKAAGGYEDAQAVLRQTRERVAAASSIVLAGAGATGVEAAGELGYAFGKPKAGEKEPQKKITLLGAGPDILGGDQIAAATKAELQKLGVTVRTGVRVLNAAEKPGGPTELELDVGGGAKETLLTDLYLPTMGLLPNTEYVDAKFKHSNGLLNVDEEFRVKAADGVWGVGDVVSIPRAAFVHVDATAAKVAKNVEAAIEGKKLAKIKSYPFDIFVCATGRDRTVGRMGSVRTPSIMGWMAKGRTLAMERLPNYINGSVA